jgi:hypothetical protein
VTTPCWANIAVGESDKAAAHDEHRDIDDLVDFG